MDTDVVVIGGGPAGATAALLLARAGRRVVVLEAARLPRDKPCGEAMMPSGAGVLAAAGVDLQAEGFPPIHGVRYRAGTASVRGEIRGYGVRRLRLDALLAERAAGTPGVTFLVGCPATGVTSEGAVSTASGELRARTVIGADGLRSPTARCLGWARPPAGRHALVGHFAITPRDEITVTMLDGLEVYSAPSAADEMLVAVMGSPLRRPGLSVADSYRETAERAHPELTGARLKGRVRGAGPFRTRPRTVARDRVFLVGDASGFLDPLTGDGMAAGLVQAAALARFLEDPATAAARYRAWHGRQWRRRWALSRLALVLTRSPGRSLAGISRRPAALQSLLEVNDGTRGLAGVSARDWAALAGF